MIVGVPKEIKRAENRVGLTDSNVRRLVQSGHQVFIQKGAGQGSFISDEYYLDAGARLLSSAQEVYERSEMIIKVKEPLPEEYDWLRKDQILYTFLHLAAERQLTKVLLDKQIKAVAYETIQEADGSLPLLRPMSEVAGRLATQVGAGYLQRDKGGKGILLGGVPGVSPGHTVIIGAGTVGFNAAFIAIGMGSKVTVLDVSVSQLERLKNEYSGKVHTLISNEDNISAAVQSADLLIGAVLVTGSKAPKVVHRQMVADMSEGSVIVDVSVDQGGCVETIRPTSHDNPIFVYEGVLHYAVPNIPGVVSRTSTYALTNQTFQYAMDIANKGLECALRESAVLAKGLNIYQGKVTHQSVAKDLGLKYYPFS